MSANPDPLDLARTRYGCKGVDSDQRGNEGGDPLGPDLMGAIGEIAFANRFGFKVANIAKPEGDGGADFTFYIGKERRTIDVKSAPRHGRLLVSERRIRKCADILVLVWVSGDMGVCVGWETRDVLLLTPPKVFKESMGANYWRSVDELRPMHQLVTILGRRNVPNKPQLLTEWQP